ncbi:hypothetical protein ACFPZ0_13880 [Streptomonospora nanhaiensis]|uniref:MFS transporter n=1 Tax=Streptomonospora nanhaiensis TaxID=1323731 RepID=A0A853BIH1_9ACTN|nr:hypothetical protein [Streptomonospora nanhaiensis]MBV2363131.1 hypothetical protein [Streptomonospora nanhaiensis]MBX9389228.1 hypothetical protein [Streptomonospora nanhaiensis]NYI94377.1 hypothetical protein [Streptomonospora nanhaiensis]
MSPKKRKRRPAGRAPARTGAPAAATEDESPGGGAAADPRAEDGGTAAPRRRVSRTPVVLDDRRRWPVAVWIALSALWLLGSAVFFVLFLAEGFALLGQDPEQAAAGMRAAAWYLLCLLVCALGVPLAGAVAAALMRRRIAAILFAVALLLSAGLLFSLDSPAGMFQALRNGLTAG